LLYLFEMSGLKAQKLQDRDYVGDRRRCTELSEEELVLIRVGHVCRNLQRARVLQHSPGGRFGLPVAVEGHWESPDVFVLDYDEVANINSFLCRFTFEGETVSLDVKERSGELDLKLRGQAKLTMKANCPWDS